ncbi:CopG family transcriptional regulator [Geothermobacter hydrogeniphilus]|uniref:CopG family transcriptional regulator n=1 Tax=Geothermobacter hydrogeniphilus TaxID=1969733 RepID=A0A1X0XSG4_9BACT|nr:CopG family transcriptional regulator [Geothermobacter hydrogeniphilus]ORJ55841.1 CopG family transcriptional regulator [Geothermobacter hydrogeniphilus]
MRTIIDLPEPQIERLREMSDRQGLSRAELVRRAVAEYLARHQGEGSEEAFGLWKKRKTDSLNYQDQLREEWQR